MLGENLQGKQRRLLWEGGLREGRSREGAGSAFEGNNRVVQVDASPAQQQPSLLLVLALYFSRCRSLEQTASHSDSNKHLPIVPLKDLFDYAREYKYEWLLNEQKEAQYYNNNNGSNSNSNHDDGRNKNTYTTYSLISRENFETAFRR